MVLTLYLEAEDRRNLVTFNLPGHLHFSENNFFAKTKSPNQLQKGPKMMVKNGQNQSLFGQIWSILVNI
jgi:hypothetical protein